MRYLLIIFAVTSYLSANNLYNLDSRFHPVLSTSFFFLDQDSLPAATEMVEPEDSLVVYPARPMLYSLILPGAGQWYNKSPAWKIGLFAGIEAASIFSGLQWKKKAEDIRLQYEIFADQNWDLETWVFNTLNTPIGNYADVHINGTHKLTLVLSGSLAVQYGNYVSSDSLENNAHWVYTNEVSVLRDRDFYENIGKYDQFVGGWIDCYGLANNQLWFEVEKDVGDSTEIIISTPNKENYVNQRGRSNDYLNMAKYAVSAVMFNHVISALEAVWSTQIRNRTKKERKVQTNVGLLYNQHAKYGVGGIAVSLHW
jgi:hypothetical protein